METQTPTVDTPLWPGPGITRVKITSGNKHELGFSPGCLLGRWSLSSYLSTSVIIQAVFVTLTAQLLRTILGILAGMAQRLSLSL